MVSDGLKDAIKKSILAYVKLHDKSDVEIVMSEMKNEYGAFSTLRPIHITKLIYELEMKGRIKIKKGQVIWKR